MNIQELYTLPSFYFPALSFQKDRVAYFGNASGRMELYILEIATKNTSCISHGNVPLSISIPPVWTRDGRRLITVSDINGDEQFDIYGFDIETGTRYLMTHSRGVNYPLEFSPNDHMLLFLSTRNGNLNLFTVDRYSRVVTQVTHFKKTVSRGTFAPDGTIFFCGNTSRHAGNLDIFRMNSDGSKLEKFWSSGNGTIDMLSVVSPCGTYLGITSDASGIKRSGVIEINGKKVFWLTHGIHESEGPLFSPKNNLISTINVEGSKRPRLFRKVKKTSSLHGSIRYIAETASLPGGFVSLANFIDDETLLLCLSDPCHREKMIVYNFSEAKSTLLLDSSAGNYGSHEFADGRSCSFTSRDGKKIHGILYRPYRSYSDGPVPAIIRLHGGPQSQSFLSFSEEVQAFISLGMAVLEVNYRGSTGFGKHFKEANTMDWGGGDLEDILAGREMLTKLDWVDSKKIAICGSSFGGYLTYLAMLKYPEMWYLGISHVGITDLLHLYTNSMPHFRSRLQYYMGNPKKNKKLWVDRSPITHAGNLARPLLIIHGEHDSRVPIAQARRMRDALLQSNKKEGKCDDFEYIELEGIGHGSFDRREKIRVFNCMSDFLDRRMFKVSSQR